MHNKSGEDRKSISEDMIVDRQTHTHTHTDTLITILRSPIGGRVTTTFHHLWNSKLASKKLDINSQLVRECFRPVTNAHTHRQPENIMLPQPIIIVINIFV